MSFRISFGNVGIDESADKPLIVSVNRRIKLILSNKEAQLSKGNCKGGNRHISSKKETISGRRVTFNIYHEKVEEGLLVVVQGFLPGKWPINYISCSRFGYMICAGMIIREDGVIAEPPRKYLWKYK